MMSPEERKLRATRAQALLDDPLFSEAVRMLQDEQTEVFLSTACDDAQVLEARRMVLALSAVRDRLVSFVTDGKMATKRTT